MFEARELALLLRAGSLAAPIVPIEERTIGPSLGRDNIDRGVDAILVGYVLVVLFIGLWYRMFGMLANVALFMNVIMIVALMSLIPGAALTLPGIAGIVLTVGMSVDANVLIFERIREELGNGNTPQASIRAGWDKAYTTIVDSNLTTLIAAIVLFMYGTGPIKGFAVTLSIGIADVDVHGDHRDARARESRLRLAHEPEVVVDRRPQARQPESAGDDLTVTRLRLKTAPAASTERRRSSGCRR